MVFLHILSGTSDDLIFDKSVCSTDVIGQDNIESIL